MPEPPQKKSAPSTSPVTPTAAPPSQSGPPVSTPPAAPAPTTSTETLPPETAPTPPALLAALDAGDVLAVRTWVAAHTPEPKSLMYYALLAGVGALGLVEWPTVAVGALAQLIIDRRFAGVENLAAELRARLAGRPVPADTP